MELPQEILLYIAIYLNLKSITNFKLVCRLFNQLANDNIIWRNLCDQYFPEREKVSLEPTWHDEFFVRYDKYFKPLAPLHRRMCVIAIENDTQRAKKLAKKKEALIDPNAIQSSNTTLFTSPILMARRHSNYSIINSFFKMTQPRSLFNRSKSFNLPFAIECLQPVKKIMRTVKKKGINPIDAEDSALALACKYGYTKLVKVLLKAGANIEINDKSKFTPLHHACKSGYQDIVKILLKEKANIEALTLEDFTPLYLACLGGHLAVVQTLVESGAIINPFESGTNPLFAACKNGHLNIIKYLHENGADLDRDYLGCSLFYKACSRGFLAIVDYLFTKGVDIEKTYLKCKPISAACKNGHLAIIEFLIRKEASLGMITPSNHSLFYIAAIFGRVNVIDFLLTHESQKSHRNESTLSQLAIEAKSKGHLIVAERLKEAAIVASEEEKAYRP